MTKIAQGAAPGPAPAKPRRQRVQVRQSAVHGKGVFALADIRAGETIIEYIGERISWQEALRRHPHDPAQPHHTFYFHIDEQHVIDANVGGNAARWINHACDTNCEADEVDGRVFIKALRDVRAGEELFYDYGLVIDERHTAKLKREYACHCASPGCRGTMLAPKRNGTRLAKSSARGAHANGKSGGGARSGKSGGAARSDKSGGAARRGQPGGTPAER